ncbi:MAG: carbohydrate porin [Verrucomicrobiota bacterium]
MKRLAPITLVCLSLSLPALAHPPFDDLTNNDVLTEDSDEIGTQIELLEEARRKENQYGPLLNPYFNEWDKFWVNVDDATGFVMGFAYTTVYMAATNGTYNAGRSGGSGDLDIFGLWHVFNRDNNDGLIGEGTLAFNTEYRHRIGDITPADLANSIGSLWPTTFGFNEQDISIIELWWQQHLLFDELVLRVGKIDMSNLFDAYGFNSANYFYQNNAFSSNPTIPFPSNGPALALEWKPSEDFFLIAGIADGEGVKTETFSSSLFNVDSWFIPATVAWMPEVAGLGRGLYQFTAWHSEERDNSDRPSANGFSIIAQQELPNAWVPFVRYSRSTRSATDTRQLITAGAVLERPFNRENDRLGLAAGWGQPHDQDVSRDQWVAEIFYRLALTPEMQISPHIQLIVDPSDNPDTDTIGIFGIRTRINF